MPQTTGRLCLEAVFSRSQTIYTGAYKFRGSLKFDLFKRSFETIVDAVPKFKLKLEYRSHNDFDWINSHLIPGERVHFIESDEFESTVKSLSEDAYNIRKNSNGFPFNLTIIKLPQLGSAEEFGLVFQGSHEYLDGRSGDNVFRLVAEHYNATLNGDFAKAESAQAKASNLKTLSTEEVVRAMAGPNYNLMANIQEITQYPMYDIGKYCIPESEFSVLIPKLAKRRRYPNGCFFDAKSLFDKCRSVHPRLSKSAILTAALHKALYNINVQHKGAPTEHNISGRMISDILSPELRDQCIGNYLAFVPITTPGHLPIEDIAKLIHDRIIEFKNKLLDLTCFQLIDIAAKQNMIGKFEAEYSYTISNVANRYFLSNPELISGCESICTMNVANYDPLDNEGFKQVNRAMVSTNLNFKDQIYFSMRLSLREDEVNFAVQRELAGIFGSAQPVR